jgi:hypothetical protein
MRWLPKRWWFWGGTGFILVALVAGYLLVPEPRISHGNCDRIQIGWTRSQVEDFLGKPDLEGYLDDEPMLIWEDEGPDSAQIRVVMTNAQLQTVCFKNYHHGPYLEVFMRRLQRRIQAFRP